MNITQMHTAIDVGVNHLNSNRYRKLPYEVKDILLNSCIEEFALKASNDIGASMLTPNTRDEIKATITNLRNLYTVVDLAKLPNSYSVDDRYDSFELPRYSSDIITDGYIRHQTEYYIVDRGATDWTGIFSDFVSNGKRLISNISPIDSISQTCNIVKEFTYKVIDKGTYDWSNVGYDPTLIRSGVVIKPTDSVTVPAGTNIKLQPLFAEVDWDDSILRIVNNFNMLVHQSINVTIAGRDISKGNIEVGSYMVTNHNAQDDLSIIGGSILTTVGDVLICSKRTKINFRYGTTIALLKSVPCLIGTEELINTLSLNTNYSNSTTPLAIISNNEIKIYHNSNFRVITASMTYLRIPRKVSKPYDISSDLYETSHANIVNMAIARSLSYIRGENYKEVKAEQAIEQKTHRI